MTLVVVIIIILILGSVSLHMLLGENGLILRSKDFVSRYDQSEKNELDILGNLGNEIDDLINSIPEDKEKESFIYLLNIPDFNKTYTIDLPTGNFEYDFKVDWGDGSKNEVKSQADSNKTHTYSQAGEYLVTLDGKAQGGIFFYGESRLKAILTGYPKNMDVTQASFFNTFDGCSSLTQIPENLFANTPNITSFYATFFECSSLIKIPERLFYYTPKVTSFYATFGACTNLTQIPEKLFENNINVVSFESTFSICTTLTQIPRNLFINNINVISFEGTFQNCVALKGDAIALWERTNITSHLRCYSNCTMLSNYYSIPTGWK